MLFRWIDVYMCTDILLHNEFRGRRSCEAYTMKRHPNHFLFAVSSEHFTLRGVHAVQDLPGETEHVFFTQEFLTTK